MRGSRRTVSDHFGNKFAKRASTPVGSVLLTQRWESARKRTSFDTALSEKQQLYPLNSFRRKTVRYQVACLCYGKYQNLYLRRSQQRHA